MSWLSIADNLVRNLGGSNPPTVTVGDQYPPIEELIDLEQSLKKMGVIRQIHDVEIISEPIQVFGAVVLQGGQYPEGNILPPRICGGSGFTPGEARTRAYGEATERYCAALYDERGLRLSSYTELRSEAISPDSFALYSQEQYDSPGFEYRPFLEDTQVNWVQGYSLTYQRPVFVPAALVYLPYWPVGKETCIGLFPSTGLSCGRSFIEAALRGIFEVIERDAIMLMWLNQLAAYRVDSNSIGNTRVRNIVNAIEVGTIKVFDITTDVPIITRFALLIDSYRGRSLVSCGAATRWESNVASEKAVMEALVVRRAVQKVIKTYPLRNYGKYHQKVRELADHLNYYTNPDALAAMDFLDRTQEVPEVEGDVSMARRELSHQLRACVDMLADRNLEAIVVDLTKPEVADVGLHVVRVIIPGMVPLTFGTGYACTGSRRLSEVPRALGYDLSDGRIRPNPVPHPFA